MPNVQGIQARLHTRKVRGLRTAWLESGNPKGPLLLFLHGFPDDPGIWDEQVKAFSRHYHILRPFARGVPPSEPATRLSRYGTDGFAMDCLSILEKADPHKKKPLICIGHDLGAAHGWHLATLLGKRLNGLVIFNGASLNQMANRLRSPRQILRSWYIYLMQVPGIPETLLRMGAPQFLNLAQRLGGYPAAESDSYATPKERVIQSFKQYRAFAREMPKRVLRPVPRLKAPVLVIWGIEDPFLISPNQDEFERHALQVTIRILQGGHWVYRERPAEVNQLLGDFFRKIGAISERTH